jgi:hypothetical protein
MRFLVFVLALSIGLSSAQAKPLTLNGDTVTVLRTQLFGQDHICRHYTKSGKFIKKTRNWKLDNLYHQKFKAGEKRH